MNTPADPANERLRFRRPIFIVVTLLLVFGAIRLMDAVGAFFLDTSAQYYVLPPGNAALGTNSLGLRNRELGPKAGTRILFLGDSFTQGLGVLEEDGFVRRSEKTLRQRFQVEHVNAGMTGFSPGNELGLLRAIREKVQPDIVVLCLYQNDVYESGESLLLRRMKQNQQKKLGVRILFWIAPNTANFVYRTFLQKTYNDLLMSQALTLDRTQAMLIASDSTREKQPQVVPASAFQPALALIQSEVRKYAKEMGADESATDRWLAQNGQALVDGRNPQEVLLGLLEPEYFSQVYGLDARARPKFETMLKNIRRIKEETEQSGAAFAVVYIPSDVRYDKSKFDLMRSYGYAMDESWLHDRVPMGIELRQRMEKENIPFLNLLDTFRRAPGPLTFPRDQHLNRHGHDVAAAAVAHFLEASFQSRIKPKN